MSPRAMFWANVALAVLCLAVAVLQIIGCTDPAPADHTAPDLGPCIGQDKPPRRKRPPCNAWGKR